MNKAEEVKTLGSDRVLSLAGESPFGQKNLNVATRKLCQ